MGMMLQLMSIGATFSLLVASPNRMAFYFSLGNTVQLCGSFFLIGPQEQLRQMGVGSRVVFTMAYVASIVATLVAVHLGYNFVVVTACLSF